MKEFVQQLIGTYQPVTTGEGIGTVDFAYIFGGIIFCLFMVYTFKIIMRCIYRD